MIFMNRKADKKDYEKNLELKYSSGLWKVEKKTVNLVMIWHDEGVGWYVHERPEQWAEDPAVSKRTRERAEDLAVSSRTTRRNLQFRSAGSNNTNPSPVLGNVQCAAAVGVLRSQCNAKRLCTLCILWYVCNKLNRSVYNVESTDTHFTFTPRPGDDSLNWPYLWNRYN